MMWRLRNVGSAPFTLVAIVLACLGIAARADAQAPVFTDFVVVTGDGGGGAVTDWGIQVDGGTFASMGFFASGSPLTQFNLMNNAPGGAASLGPSGLGIGFGAFAGSGNRLAQVPLHVVGGGAEDAYGESRIIVANRSSSSGFRDMLTLSNEGGGGVRLSLDDGGTGSANYKLDNFNGRFNLWNDTSSQITFGVASNSATNVEIAGNGVGIGTLTPTSKLHVFSAGGSSQSSTITSEVTSGAGTADRTALNLVNHGGTFMTFTDTSSNATWFFSNKNDELFLKKSGVGSPGLRFLATGEARFVNGGTNLLRILPTGSCQATSFVSLSDRNVKENIVPVDPAEVLDRVASLPVSTWSYIKDENGTRHMGPMAQDFHAAFGLGTDDRTIAEMDRSGVALAAIQGLNCRLEREAGEVTELQKTVTGQAELIGAQQDRIAELEARLERLEALLPAVESLPQG